MPSKKKRNFEDSESSKSATKNGESNTRKGRFRCDECGKSLASSSGLDAHIKTVHGEKIFACEYCEKAFARKDHLFNHKRSIHTGLKYCTQCKKTFTGREGLAEHIRDYHGGNGPSTGGVRHGSGGSSGTSSNLVCDICDKVFASKYKLRQHTKAGHVVRQCSICKETFVGDDKLVKHVRDKHSEVKDANGVVVYKCIYCSGTFARESSLDQHIQSFHAEQKCLICGCSTFVGAQDIARHIRLQHPPKKMTATAADSGVSFHCESCGKSFALKSQFDDHVLQKHTWSSVKVHRTFDSISPVKKNNSPVALYQCEVCDELFANEFHMREHSREVHSFFEDSVVSSYQCVICENLFDSEYSLDEHISDLHRTPSPLPHEEEQQQEQEQGQLIVLSPLDETFNKIFAQCDSCQELFTDEAQLKDHVSATHHNNVFKCQECNDSFVDDVGLERHISKVHLTSDMMDDQDGHVKVFFQCTLCEDLCEDKTALETHVQAYHPFQEEEKDYYSNGLLANF